MINLQRLLLDEAARDLGARLNSNACSDTVFSTPSRLWLPVDLIIDRERLSFLTAKSGYFWCVLTFSCQATGDQARLVWRNIEAQLNAADMSLDNLAKVTIFLSDRSFAEENRSVRNEILDNRAPALTVIIAGIFDSAWLLEIEAIAVA